jgi:hypothetical protein
MNQSLNKRRKTKEVLIRKLKGAQGLNECVYVCV